MNGNPSASRTQKASHPRQAMLAMPAPSNNAVKKVIHRFHKRGASVFHSIHRLWTSEAKHPRARFLLC